MSTQHEAVIEALDARGFRYVGRTSSRWMSFSGDLKTSEGTYGCEVSIDPDFYALPKIRLQPIPKSLHPIAPHIGGDGGICYLAKGMVVLDFFDPVGL